MKSNYHEPKYTNLINQKLKSKHTKSKNLHLHIYLIVYDDPEAIPFNAIAEVTDTDANKIRALIRSANDPKTYLGLLDVGVDPQDIPSWYSRPKFIKKIVKRAKAKVIEETKVHSPKGANMISHPLKGMNLPSTYRPRQVLEPETTFYYEDNSDEKYLSPAQAELWRMFIEKLRHDNLREEKYYEARRKLYARANRAPTHEELSAWYEIHQLNQTLQINMHFQEFLYWYPIYQQMFPPSITRTEAMGVIAGFKEIIDTLNRILYETKPISVPVKIIPYVPPDNEDLIQELDEIEKSLDNQKPANLQAIADLGQVIQEEKRLAKLIRYGPEVQPMKIHYPPGFVPEQLLDGPKGERITKLLNLDHLRPH